MKSCLPMRYRERMGPFSVVFGVPLNILDIANRRHVFGRMGQFSSLLTPTKDPKVSFK